jgi:site-specific DNA recombinase
VLLSFAQFERELIAERTRDKMGAARRRGRWLGGTPVLGYDVDGRSGQLAVNAEEARQVRAIFQLYLERGSLTATVRELERRGWVSKRWTTRAGRCRGGRPYRKGTLHALLTNVTYRGQVRHRGELYPGRHEPIVTGELFDQVAQQLGRNRVGDQSRRTRCPRGWLQGLLHCHHCGTPMDHGMFAGPKRRWRCYFCPRVNAQSCPAPRLPAAQLERAVVEQFDPPSDAVGLWPSELMERVEYDSSSRELVIRWKPARTDA